MVHTMSDAEHPTHISKSTERVRRFFSFFGIRPANADQNQDRDDE